MKATTISLYLSPARPHLFPLLYPLPTLYFLLLPLLSLLPRLPPPSYLSSSFYIFLLLHLLPEQPLHAPLRMLTRKADFRC